MKRASQDHTGYALLLVVIFSSTLMASERHTNFCSDLHGTNLLVSRGRLKRGNGTIRPLLRRHARTAKPPVRRPAVRRRNWPRLLRESSSARNYVVPPGTLLSPLKVHDAGGNLRSTGSDRSGTRSYQFKTQAQNQFRNTNSGRRIFLRSRGVSAVISHRG
jgi:hypothetical protein